MSRLSAGPVRWLLVVLAMATLAFSALPWLLPSERSRRFLYADEAGLFEQISVGLWLGLAAALLWFFRPLTWRAGAAAVVCLAAAAREADWHKAFTAESALKFSYYLDGTAPLLQRLGIGVIVLGCVACAVVVALAVVNHLRAGDGDRSAWGPLLLIAVIVGVVSKTLDRLPDVADSWFNVSLPAIAEHMMQANEEGLEMLLPVLLGIAALAAAHARSRAVIVRGR